jgi:hypothetical protein
MERFLLTERVLGLRKTADRNEDLYADDANCCHSRPFASSFPYPRQTGPGAIARFAASVMPTG